MGCDKDPIFGLKRGWLLYDEDESYEDIYFPLIDISIEYHGDFPILIDFWEGLSNEGEPDTSLSLSNGDVRVLDRVVSDIDIVYTVSNNYVTETNTLNTYLGDKDNCSITISGYSCSLCDYDSDCCLEIYDNCHPY